MTTPTKFFICGRNLADSAAISATVAAVATLPLTHLQNSDRDFVWRSSSDAAVDLIFNLEGGLSDRINFCHLSRHNLETAATWRVQLYPTYDASGAASYDSGTVDAMDAATLSDLDWGVDPLGGQVFDGFPRFSTVYFMENTATVINSVRITITDTGNSDGYVEAARVYFGRGVEMGRGLATLDPQWDEGTKQKRTDGGSLSSDGAENFRKMALTVKNLTAAERAELMDVARYAGMRRDVFASAYPGAGGELQRDHEGIWRFTAMPKFPPTPGVVDAWSTTMQLAEG
jgi:hypothetical protein